MLQILANRRHCLGTGKALYQVEAPEVRAKKIVLEALQSQLSKQIIFHPRLKRAEDSQVNNLFNPKDKINNRT
jgi:hypothetical protein